MHWWWSQWLRKHFVKSFYDAIFSTQTFHIKFLAADVDDDIYSRTLKRGKKSANQTTISVYIFSSLRTFFIDDTSKNQNSIFILCVQSLNNKKLKKNIVLFLMRKTNRKNLINKCIKNAFFTFQLSDVSDVHDDGISIFSLVSYHRKWVFAYFCFFCLLHIWINTSSAWNFI